MRMRIIPDGENFLSWEALFLCEVPRCERVNSGSFEYIDFPPDADEELRNKLRNADFEMKISCNRKQVITEIRLQQKKHE